jgi:hypothetical protein
MLAFASAAVLPCSKQIIFRRTSLSPIVRPLSLSASSFSEAAVRKQVLILGGTGRVGSAAALSLGSLAKGPLDVTLGGRNARRGEAIAADLNIKFSATADTTCPVTFRFVTVDISSKESLDAALSSPTLDLVVHTAGPFQQRNNPADVLQAAIRARKDYMDVCDDSDHALACRSLSSDVMKAGIAAWICTGIYPGVSNLLAASCIKGSPTRHRATAVRFSYYTAGTGGIGATVLASTFLILSERATTFNARGQLVKQAPASGLERVDFGGRIGIKSVYLLNLPEVASVHEVLLAPTGGGIVHAKLSTDPPIWNWLLRVTASLVPSSILRNRAAMQALSAFSLPAVQMVDRISGARTGIRVDVDFEDGSSAVGLYEHETLRGCVGDSTAAFAAELLYAHASAPAETSTISPGVYYPEELGLDACMTILRKSAISADRFIVEHLPQHNKVDGYGRGR